MRKIGSFVVELVQVVVFAVSIFLFVYLLVLQPHKIQGSSMEPNFHDGEYLLTDKLSYRLGEPNRGDVIVFRAPPSFTNEFIKRILGLPGDKIMVKDGDVYVNGKLVEESYIPEEFITRQGQFVQNGEEVEVPDNQYFVLGDNREHSQDSRSIGFIDKKYITGRAWVVYWPVKDMGVIEAPNYFF